MSKLTSRGSIQRQILSQMSEAPGVPFMEIHTRDANVLAASIFGLCLSLFAGAGWLMNFTRCMFHDGCVYTRAWRP